VPLFETGALQPVIDRRYAFVDIAQGHTYMESNANIGKIVIDISAN
jgi:NADPH:quinone reductase-like Zn-dependent oxidoreductase